MPIFTVLITNSTIAREVYGGLPACTTYLNDNADDNAVAFQGLDVDGQGRALIGATRYLDAFFWQGVATGLAGGTPTTLQFPRTGLTDQYGAALDATNVPAVFVNAVFEMAAIVAADPSVASNLDQGSNVSRLGAGPANLGFFRPTSAADGNATLLPVIVDRLIGRWRAAAPAVGGFITGTNPRSDFGLGCFTGCRGCGVSPCCCGVTGTRNVVLPL